MRRFLPTHDAGDGIWLACMLASGQVSAKWLALILGMCLVLLSACSREAGRPAATAIAGEEAKAVEPAVIVAMGDSLTEGLGVAPDDAYPAQLERKLLEDGHVVSVINAGSSGETSSGALSRVDWVLGLQPDILILATGGNDGLRGIDPELTKQNVESIVRQFLDKDVIVVLAGMEMVQNMGKEYTSAFSDIYPAVADAHDLIYMPFFLQGVGAVPELNQADSIHPNAKGYAVVVDTMYPFVEESIVQLAQR